MFHPSGGRNYNCPYNDLPQSSTVGIMVPVGVIFTVIVARILYKRGVL